MKYDSAKMNKKQGGKFLEDAADGEAVKPIVVVRRVQIALVEVQVVRIG
jgi:hypothetical protein